MADGWTDRPGGRGDFVRKFAALPHLYHPDNAADILEMAETGLLNDRPDASCTLGLTEFQKRRMTQTACVTGLLALCLPEIVLLGVGVIASAFFAVFMLQRLMVVLAGAGVFGAAYEEVADEAVTEPQIWPVYTILVPVYREPASIGQLVAALKELDYPKRQLDIIILLEEDDLETLAALHRLSLLPCFRVVRLPPGRVKTKPRALNYGLQIARGQYVAIYDAEDEMHADQLKAAVRAFQSDRIANGQPPLACVQAPLVPNNGADSWIAGQFAQEYAVQFSLLVPGLARLRLPVPLGGTSNHFDRRVLEEIGGWDPFNVTEDADLGLRIARAGYRVGSISPPTFEEAPVGAVQWVKQRSRWIKGYIQTLGVFMRSPVDVMSRIGFWGFVNAVCLVGGVAVSAVCHGPFLAVLILCAVLPGVAFPMVAVPLLTAGLCVHLLSVVLARRQWSLLRFVALISAPFYWPLQSVAAAKAIVELFTRPYYWDKTEHGVSKAARRRQAFQAVK